MRDGSIWVWAMLFAALVSISLNFLLLALVVIPLLGLEADLTAGLLICAVFELYNSVLVTPIRRGILNAQ